jgi:rod shape-determining protein MreC
VPWKDGKLSPVFRSLLVISLGRDTIDIVVPLFNRFWRNNRALILKLALLLSPLIPLMVMKAPPIPRLHLYDRVQSYFVHPIAEGLHNARRGSSVVFDRYMHLVDVQIENEKLRAESDKLRAEILALEEVQIENQRLKKALNMPILSKSNFVTGQIIGQDSNPESLGFFINVGSNNGVKPRMPVVSYNGIVGTVMRVYPNSSMFLAVQDPSHAVDGTIRRSRARFIVQGQGKPLIGHLKYLDRAEDIRVGDAVITSGLDGVFPKGLLVGSIVKVQRPKSGITQTAEVRASANLGQIEEVMVITSQPIDMDFHEDEITPLASGPIPADRADKRVQ